MEFDESNSIITSIADSNEKNHYEKAIASIGDTNGAEKVQFDFGECKICHDKASGIHYGIASCEGCKGFYKRSLNKHETYKCSNKNKCIIKKNSRNRCKACRFNKCLQLGMSIDGIRMGRIPKSEKLKSQTSEKKAPIECASMNKEINALVIFNRNNPVNKYINNSTIYYPKEFKLWLNSQLSFLKTVETDTKYNIMRLVPNALEIIEPLDTFNNIDMFNLPQVTSYNSDQCEIIMLSVFKDRVYEIYKRHVKISHILNDTRERLRSKKYIDIDEKNMSVEEISNAIGLNIFFYNQWLHEFVKELPGLNKFDSEDLNILISNCSLLSIAVHINDFYDGNESYQIANGYRLSRSRMNIGFGTFMTTLFFMINHKIKSLNLTDNEIAMFYPFSLFSSKEEYLKDKQNFHKFKVIYTKLLVYTLKINGRDSEFLQKFKEVLELISIGDICKETFFKCFMET